ncbi:YfhL family 4Fe-4S dicluster ferredoxin [Gammaproteobacteria bacterium]|nr:YfhL family 4Fe-4S dicluster ferredoxin [Gammaproteobacteria bacterium]
MSLKIHSTCVNCDVCEPACPNQAIYQGDQYYHIDPDKCTECVGHYEEPECQALCPVEDCITLDPNKKETQQQLTEKFERLKSASD